MAIDPRFGLTERLWPTVIQTPISITGWKVTVTSTAGIKVHQSATLSKPGQESLEFEVKRVLNKTELLLGIKGQGQPATSGITQFNGGTFIVNEQSRNKLGDSPIARAVYEEEPTIAIRTILVDQFGTIIDSVTDNSGTNRLAVDASVTVDLKTVKNLEVQNITIPTANTEYTLVLPANIFRFMFRVRGSAANVKLAFSPGASGTTYFQNQRGNIFDSGELNTGAYNVYYQVDKPDVTLEWLLFKT